MESSSITPRDGSPGEVRRAVAPPPVEIGDTLGDRFLLGSVIGCGATGMVFSALDRAVGEKVAIKLLHPDLHDDLTKERLRREVRASRPGHPNAVTIYDLHEADGHVFLSMELIEGASLRDLLTNQRQLDPEEVVPIGKQIAAALDHLHARGIVHRDVKPGNILITPDGTAKLCDMGLARPLEHGMTLTATEMVVGTPAYMAPEQGVAGDLTSASDVYALGLTMYRSLTGTVPITAETAVATLTRRQRERAPAVRGSCPDCPRWLNRLVRRMLEPRPGDRPSAAQVVNALSSRKMWPRAKPKAVAAIASAAVFVGMLAFLGPRLLAPETARVDHEGATIFGLDSDGRKTWSYDLPDPPRFVERVDLNGDGRTEIVVAGPAPLPDEKAKPPARSRSYVIALTENGERITEVVPEKLIGQWRFPYRLDIVPKLHFADLDGDGFNEIIVNTVHNGFYPAVLLAYWPRWDAWDSLLHHPGGINAIASACDSGRPGLRFVAYNNLLGMTRVFGEIELVPPGDRPQDQGRASVLSAPPGLMPRSATVGSWRAYVPYAEGDGSVFRDDRITVERRPDLVVSLRDRGPTFDAFFNPIAGPNRGLDLRDRRLEFAAALHLVADTNRAITTAGVKRLVDRVRQQASPLMNEAPYDLILSNLAARSLAVAGDPNGAVSLLEETRHRWSNDALLRSLAQLYALTGNYQDARATLLEVIDSGANTQSRYDAPLELLQLAIRLHDAEDVATAIEYLTVRGASKQLLPAYRNALTARAHLWWDRCTATDGQVRTVFLYADGDAIAGLARWRLGRLTKDDADRMRASIELNPDSFKMGTIALAAALTANGRPDDALAELDRVISALMRSAKWDFTDAEILKLAKAVRTVALDATGDREAAVTSARALASDLDPNLLPGILVREVLDQPSPR